MATVSKWEWVKAGVTALLAILAGIFLALTRRRSERLGEEKGALEADRQHLRDAAEAGDDSGVYEAWRQSTRGKQ